MSEKKKPENEFGIPEAKTAQTRFGAIGFAVATALLTAMMVALVYVAAALP